MRLLGRQRAPAAVVTVAIPVLNGGELLVQGLQAIARQVLAAEVEILVADSGSSDGSPERAREHGARVIEIPRSGFAHGRTRNLLLEEARGTRVALLSQDAEPLDELWLAHLLEGFEQGDDVALVYGPYIARPGASPNVRRSLERWFGSIDAGAERLAAGERDIPAVELMGRRGFFSDANACVSRAAWQRVRFREIAYAEDRALALDMLRAGYAKVYEPRAGVLHSHDYGSLQRFQRAFDEWRGLAEVYGWREPASPRHLVAELRGELSAARREGAGPLSLAGAAADRSLTLAGAVLGSRARMLPDAVQRHCSLEGTAATATSTPAIPDDRSETS
ncbi:MAG: glycosyltransferase [Solirubrobacteraceae bacterium]|jgi:rhamnosyltransferase